MQAPDSWLQRAIVIDRKWHIKRIPRLQTVDCAHMQITYLTIREGQQLCIRILDLYILYVEPGQSIWLIAFRGCERWSSQSAVSPVAKSSETSGRPTLDCSRQVSIDNVSICWGSTTMFSAESFHRIIKIVQQAEYQEGDALDALQLKRYCCRRMLLGHVVRSLKVFTRTYNWIFCFRT